MQRLPTAHRRFRASRGRSTSGYFMDPRRTDGSRGRSRSRRRRERSACFAERERDRPPPFVEPSQGSSHSRPCQDSHFSPLPGAPKHPPYERSGHVRGRMHCRPDDHGHRSRPNIERRTGACTCTACTGWGRQAHTPNTDAGAAERPACEGPHSDGTKTRSADAWASAEVSLLPKESHTKEFKLLRPMFCRCRPKRTACCY